MTVSVVIAAYNAEKTLAECLTSLVNQTLKGEIIVVDDGSTDNTTKIAKEVPGVIYLKTPHEGPGKARNYGVSKATGEIVCFLDSDMTFAEDFLEKLIEPIRKQNVTGTFTKLEYVKNWNNVWAKLWNFEYTGTTGQLRLPPNYPNEAPVFRAIKKSAFEKVGGFDHTGYNDDWTVSQKLQEMAIAAPGAKMYHANPGNLKTVYLQARWIGGRTYRWGELGRFLALIRASFPVSLIKSIQGIVVVKKWQYLPFKVVFDFGIFVGIIRYWLGFGHAK